MRYQAVWAHWPASFGCVARHDDVRARVAMGRARRGMPQDVRRLRRGRRQRARHRRQVHRRAERDHPGRTARRATRSLGGVDEVHGHPRRPRSERVGQPPQEPDNAALEASLRRLDTDYVDLYWVHIWDRATPLEETMRALDDAVRAGKVLYVGVSDMPAWTVARANTIAELRGWTPFAGIQVRYNLAQRDIERELLPMADALGLSVAAWSPLAAGLLSGKFNRGEAAKDARLAGREISERELEIAGLVQDVAAELGATPSQVAARLDARAPQAHPSAARGADARAVDRQPGRDRPRPAGVSARAARRVERDRGRLPVRLPRRQHRLRLRRRG